MRNRRFFAVTAVSLTLVVASALAAGCGRPKAGAYGAPADSVSGAGVVSPASTAETVALRVYFGDAELARLIERSVDVPKADTPELIRRALSEMAHPPGGGAVALAGALEVRSVSMSGGVVRIDVHVRPEGRLGAPGELLLVNALKQTFFQFDDVREVEMTVDGRRVESLMGHVELPYPMLRG